MKISILAVILIGTLFMLFCCESQQETTAANNNTSLAERGKYLVTSIGCSDCHTPKKMTEQGPVPDETLLLSGHPEGMPLAPVDKKAILEQGWVMLNPHFTACVGPWGVSYAANLSPSETGLGNWTLDHFKRAMREGKYKGMENGRTLLPPMPWPNFTHLTDQDLEAMYEYLKTIPAIENVVPPAVPLENL